MIDSVKVVYSYSAGSVSFDRLFCKLRSVAVVQGCDFNLCITQNRVTANFYPFRYTGAKPINEKQGARVLSACVCLFDDIISDGHLLSVDMEPALPF